MKTHNIIVYTARDISVISVTTVKKCRPWSDAASGLGLHFLHMSDGPFSNDACLIMAFNETRYIRNEILSLFTQALKMHEYLPMYFIKIYNYAAF